MEKKRKVWVEVLSDFYKNNPDDAIWWVDEGETVDGAWESSAGEWLFSFDKKKIYNMFRDYPDKLTAKEKAIFDRENPFWADFFKDRTR